MGWRIYICISFSFFVVVENLFTIYNNSFSEASYRPVVVVGHQGENVN